MISETAHPNQYFLELAATFGSNLKDISHPLYGKPFIDCHNLDYFLDVSRGDKSMSFVEEIAGNSDAACAHLMTHVIRCAMPENSELYPPESMDRSLMDQAMYNLLTIPEYSFYFGKFMNDLNTHESILATDEERTRYKAVVEALDKAVEKRKNLKFTPSWK